MKDYPLWQAIPIALAMLVLIIIAFWLANVRDSATLFWATVALCVSLLPPIIDGWYSGRGKPRPFRLDGDR